jgi:hypothetical protein
MGIERTLSNSDYFERKDVSTQGEWAVLYNHQYLIFRDAGVSLTFGSSIGSLGPTWIGPAIPLIPVPRSKTERQQTAARLLSVILRCETSKTPVELPLSEFLVLPKGAAREPLRPCGIVEIAIRSDLGWKQKKAGVRETLVSNQGEREFELTFPCKADGVTAFTFFSPPIVIGPATYSLGPVEFRRSVYTDVGSVP